ncbi:hypothetical protein QC762_701880 [Podospora pseudocomata]|uniref:NF-kappa-B inhibitor-like protein 1 n=1 Tax=Podospora pseudocomata TaxID=2093779 RepID=A0ABR0G349_9PEZI|nr:hypothetical protein QC762_701880 [Podospora pseudocomata]
MADSPRSPKRRRILASINRPDHDAGSDSDEYGPRPAGQPSKTYRDMPRHKSTPPGEEPPDAKDEPHQSEKQDDPMPTDGSNQTPEADGNSTKPKPTKFRFKSKSSRSRRDRDKDREERDLDRDKRRSSSRDRTSSQSHRHRHRSRSPSDKHRRSSHRHHHQHRSSRRRRPPSPQQPDPFAPDPLDPETAFRESLFDAMADDEGAAYWEAIYGQPIHIYSNPEHVNPATGHLEKMTDEEYAEYVRQKMWEKTHAGLLEEREKRKKQKEEQAKKDEERRRIEKEMERSFIRGEERRVKRSWRTRFERYLQKWEEWVKDAAPGAEKIPWPIGVERDEEGGFRAGEVRTFFVNGLGLEETGEKEFVARLKEERVRWHPDKIQQRLLGGSGTVDKGVMRDVTAVFQVVDGLWGELRRNMGK